MKKSQKEPAKTSKTRELSPWEKFLQKLHAKIMALLADKPNDHLESVTEERAADTIVEFAAEYADAKRKESAGLKTQVNTAVTKTMLRHAISFASRQPLSGELPGRWAALFDDIVDKVDRGAGR